MGNYKFRLSDMIPNAWFYKLKDMSKSSRTNPSHQNKKKQSLPVSSQSQSQHHHRQSFYYSTHYESFTQRPPPVLPVYQNKSPSNVYFPADPPRKSSKRISRSRTRRKTVYMPSPRRVTITAATDLHQDEDCSRSCQCQAETEVASFASNSQHKSYFDSFSTSDASLEFFDLLKYAPPNGIGAGAGTESRSSSCSCGFSSPAATATTDIIIDMNDKHFNLDHRNKLLFDRIPEQLDLPPILTKPTVNPVPVKKVKPSKKETGTTPTPSPGAGGGVRGIKLRPNSPKVMATMKNQGLLQLQGRNRKNSTSSQKKVYSESFAVVKASIDPQKDFRDSMMEMIVENNIRASKDLEELLACYLSLNSDEYHHLIIKAFEQIWFNIPHLEF